MGCGSDGREWVRTEEMLPDGTGKIHKRTLYLRKFVPCCTGPCTCEGGGLDAFGTVAPAPVDPCDGYLAVPAEITPGSMLVASGTGEWYWLAPGGDGDTLRIVSGQPCWVP